MSSGDRAVDILSRKGTRLAGKVALVAGAGSIGPGWGNGKATAAVFAREGATVVALDINLDAAQETASQIEERGGVCLPLACDITDERSIADTVGKAVREFGRIDILHNNVGINVPGPTASVSLLDWERVFRINLTGMFLTCRAVLPLMLTAGSGVIVNVSSVAAIRYARIPYASYASSKAAVIAFTRTIALEHAASGMRANVILPGLLDTPMVTANLAEAYGNDADRLVSERSAQVPMRHMGDGFDVAHAALFLASDESRFITGTELIVDGGMSCSTG